MAHLSSQTIAFNLIDTVQSRDADLQEQAGNLGMTIDQAINKYEGLAGQL